MKKEYIILNKMIPWTVFEEECVKKTIYTIDNNSRKNIVFFGNCAIAPTGFFLNYLLHKNFNIHFIVSWLFEKNGFENFDMNLVNNKIEKVLLQADYFFYQHHNKDYGINASEIFKKCNPKTIYFSIPNFQLSFEKSDSTCFHDSLRRLRNNILNESDFKEFIFVYENCKNIRFFNTNFHPTHYLLFLLAISIKYKIIKNEKTIDLDTYYDILCQNQFRSIKEFVVLPGFIKMTKKISQNTGIPENAHYIDFDF